MGKLLLPANPSPRRVRYVRGLLVSIAVLVIGTIVFVFSTETRNELILINRTASPVTIEEIAVETREIMNDAAKVEANSIVLLKDHVIAPQTTFRLPLRGYRKSILTVASEKWRSRRLVNESWGMRFSISIDETQGIAATSTNSALRQWFDANRRWIPVPTGWFE
jgi:hypothetical protein